MVSLAMNAPAASAEMVVRSNCRLSPCCEMRKPPLSMIKAVVASLFCISSWRMSSSWRTSSSNSWGSVAMSCVLRLRLADELVEQQPRDHIECLEHTFAPVGRGGEGGHLHVAVVEQELHVIHRRGIGQIALVVLHHHGNFPQIQFERLEVL